MQSNYHFNEKAAMELYLVVAEFFKYPDRSSFTDIQSGIADETVNDLLQSINGVEVKGLEIQAAWRSFEEMKSEYLRLFSGLGAEAVLPVESIYKEWTDDPTAEIPLAGQKGYLYGDPALHIRHLFEQFRIVIPDVYQATPDHLTLLLEFVALLIENRQPSLTLQFMNDHLDWLDDFSHALIEAEANPFYERLIQLLMKLIDVHKQTLENEISLSF